MEEILVSSPVIPFSGGLMSTKLVGSWKVSFCQGKHADLDGYSFLDGCLQLWDKSWMVLLDHLGNPLIGQRGDANLAIRVGSSISIMNFWIRIMAVIPCVDEVAISAPEVRNADPISVVKPASGSGIPASENVKKWRVTYSTCKDLDKGRLKAYDGSLEFFQLERSLVLKNAKGFRIGRLNLHPKISFSLGAKIYFPWHIVRMGKPVIMSAGEPVLSKDILVRQQTNASPQSEGIHSSQPVTVPEGRNSAETVIISEVLPEVSTAMAVHSSLSMGLDFSHGMNFAKDVRSKFNRQVHPSAKSGHFTMVVSFGRAKFKLDEDLVSIALEAIIGGLCGELKVSIIRERVFSFCVSSKDVGFHILKLKRYSCPQFKCFFHLWGHGGPNREREFF
jgi:hypothetical protein